MKWKRAGDGASFYPSTPSLLRLGAVNLVQGKLFKIKWQTHINNFRVSVRCKMHLICSKVAQQKDEKEEKAPVSSAPSSGQLKRLERRAAWWLGGSVVECLGGWAAFKMIKVAACRDRETPTKRRKFQLNVKAKQILTLQSASSWARPLKVNAQPCLYDGNYNEFYKE